MMYWTKDTRGVQFNCSGRTKMLIFQEKLRSSRNS